MLSTKQRKSKNRKIAFGIIGIILIIAISITTILMKNNDNGDISLASINGDKNNQQSVTRENDIVKAEHSKQVEIVVTKGGTIKPLLEMNIKEPILWGLQGFYFNYYSFFVDTDMREDWEMYNENNQKLVQITGTDKFEDSNCKARVFIENGHLKLRVDGKNVGQSQFMVRVRHEDESPEHECYLSSHEFRVKITVRDDLIPSGAKVVNADVEEKYHENSAGLVEYGKDTYVVFSNLGQISKYQDEYQVEIGVEPESPQTPSHEEEGYAFESSQRWKEWQQNAKNWITATLVDENSNIVKITPKRSPDTINGKKEFLLFVYANPRQASARTCFGWPFRSTRRYSRSTGFSKYKYERLE